MTALLTPELAVEQVDRRQKVRDAAWLGALGAMLSFAFSWVPSMWFDETATVVAAERGWGSLLLMVNRVDAVHAFYYAGVHVWFDLVGYSPLTLRLPSAVAAGLGVALTVLLAARLANRRVAILAGLLMCVIPRLTWAGDEGRSYAFTIMFGAATSLALLFAMESVPARKRRWALYAAVMVLAILTFAFSALILAAHALTIAWLAARRSVGRATVVPFAITGALAAAVTVPFILKVASQSGQVGWLRDLDWSTLWDVLVNEFFIDNFVVAVFFWVLVVAGAILSRGLFQLKAVTLPLLVVPTVALLLATLTVLPLYNPRYGAMSVPALAILAAVPLARLRSRRMLIGALVVLTLATAPTYIAQHTVTVKHDTGWPIVADTLSNLRKAPGPGSFSDKTAGVYYGDAPLHNLRTIAYSYPSAFTGLKDVTLVSPYYKNQNLWEVSSPLSADQLHGLDAVWVVEYELAIPRTGEILQGAGFTRSSVTDVPYGQLELWVRG